MKLASRIEQARMTIESEPAEKTDRELERWPDGTKYEVTLTRRPGIGKVSMSLSFFMGPAHERPPEVEEVLSCVLSDAAGVLNAVGFEDWCSEYGYDTDSRRAERIYLGAQEQTANLRRFLGGTDALDAWVFETEE